MREMQPAWMHWSQLSWLNTSHAFKNGCANPNHIFKLFGDFGGHDASQVRLLLLKHIARHPCFYMRCGTVCLEMHNISFKQWLNCLADDSMYCDELGILSLCNMYRWHTMVVTVNKMWSTIEHSLPLNLFKLLNECSVKLVYLGQLCFGELKLRRPSLNLPSLPVQTSVHPSTSKQPDTSTSTDSTTGNTASAAAVAQTD